MLTVKYVQERLSEISEVALDNDYETAHVLEDRLMAVVLKDIADGNPNAVEMAAEALKSLKFSFARHCA